MTTSRMGPIERELRDRGWSKNEDWICLSLGAVTTLHRAASEAGWSLYDMDVSPDILSYAIEAAEALGL